MPTILFVNGFRFFFYSNENHEPIHVHVEKGNSHCKLWLEPHVSLAYSFGFNSNELNFIEDTVCQHHVTFKRKWNEYFGK